MRKSMLMIALLLPAAALASKPVSLVQNEYDFAADTAKLGVHDGFLLYLDKQSVTFAPKPVNAYDYYAGQKPGSTVLKWYPAYALVAASGDYGVDTGPWVAEWSKDGKPQQAYGEWLTIWSKDADGKWKALYDGGIGHPKPDTPTKTLAHDSKVPQMPAVTAAVPAEDDVHDQLIRAETVFSNDAAKSLRSAYDGGGSDDIRLLLEDGQPMLGKELADKVVPAVSSGLVWVPLGGSAARSGDLGYIYGMTYKTADTAHVAPQGTYMHVWRKSVDGWKLIIAMESPLPADTK